MESKGERPLNDTIAIGVPDIDDRSGVVHLLERSISDAFIQEGLDDIGEEIQSIIDTKKIMFDEFVQNPGQTTQIFVAKETDQIVGIISFAPRGKEIRDCTGQELEGIGELGTLYILPEYQNQKIGSALIRTLVQYLAEQGVRQFCLDSGFKRAQRRWLRKFGEPYLTAQDYWGPDGDHMVWLCNVQDHL